MKVNGKVITITQKQNLKNFLETHKFDLATLAVARNGTIVPKPTYETVMLCDEDTLEVVRFVGGG
ncbi:sulfur carrier protein ThiS [Acetobacterium woodii]|uniref:sulfur carrier protein ThiS n=1 Tax=Acetobacterium woodii TaxID=33952 RepID=UPI0002D710B2|nr:sulfur carrier protein ThiS [Acetobacterium woodii]